MQLISRLIATILVPHVVASNACSFDTSLHRKPPAGALEPGRGDSLAKLYRLLFTAEDGHQIAQALVCEQRRLGLLYGLEVANAISDIVVDSLTATPAARKAYERAQNKLGGSTFTTSVFANRTYNLVRPTYVSGRRSR